MANTSLHGRLHTYESILSCKYPEGVEIYENRGMAPDRRTVLLCVCYIDQKGGNRVVTSLTRACLMVVYYNLYAHIVRYETFSSVKA